MSPVMNSRRIYGKAVTAPVADVIAALQKQKKAALTHRLS
jgi:hypothetical protein